MIENAEVKSTESAASLCSFFIVYRDFNFDLGLFTCASGRIHTISFCKTIRER